MTYKNSYQASEEEGQLLLESEQWTQEDAMDQAKVVSDNYRAQCARELDSDLSGDDEHATEELSYEEYHEKVDAIYEKTDWNAKGDEQKFPMTSVGAIFSLLASIFGVGILEQPKIMQQVGFLTGIIILLFSVWVSHMGGYYLGIAARMTGKKSLGEIAKTAGGVLGMILSVYSLLGVCILASIGYACSWWAYTSELYVRMGLIDIETAQTSSGFASVRTLVISVMLVVLFPVCCQRDLSALAAFSFGAAGVYVVLVFLMAYYWIADYLAADPMQWDADLRYKWTLGEHNSVPLVTPTGQGQSAFHSINLNANAGAGSLGKVWADANAERAAAKEPAAIASANEKVAAARNQVEGAVDVLNHPCHGMFGFEASWFFGGSFQALFMAVGLMNTAFACHFSCVDVFGKEMQKPTRKNINFVMGLSLAVTAVIYAGFMAMGWNYARKFQDISVTPVSEEISVNVDGATQKQTVATSYSGVCQQGAQDAILKNMKNPDDEFQPTLIAVAQFVVFLVLYLTYPLLISAARSTIHGLLWPGEKSGFLKHTAETGALCLITWLGAAVIPKVTIVLAFAGCGPGLALVLILPGYIMLCLNRSLPYSHKDRVIPWLLVIFGTILSLGGIILTVIYGAEWDRAANVDMSHEAVTYARQPPKLQITHAAPNARAKLSVFLR
ncbi:unnamed protein product [Amoebophrya sp. A25]|nr:unnamed protein product [Amoebophrya sp. A25]|eukprot:GSA25T00025884001.1